MHSIQKMYLYEDLTKFQKRKRLQALLILEIGMQDLKNKDKKKLKKDRY